MRYRYAIGHWPIPVCHLKTTSPQSPFNVCEQHIFSFTQGPAVDEIERMRRSLETDTAARVEQQLALLKNAVAIPCLRTVKEKIPFHRQKRNVERVEKRNCCQAALDIRIDECEIGAHRAVSIAAMFSRGMATQYVGWIRIEAQKEIVFD